MMATSAARLPVGREWSYEVKWDGYRAQALKAGTTVSLASRNLKNITRQFPAVAEAVSRVGARTAVIDGEIVALDTDGRPSFQALHHWSLAGLSIVYYAFDLLHLNGRDLTRSPLDERRAALRGIIGDSGVWSRLRSGRGTAACVTPPSSGCATTSGRATCVKSSVATYGPRA